MKLMLVIIFILFYNYYCYTYEQDDNSLCPDKSTILPCSCKTITFNLKFRCTHSELSKILQRLKYLNEHLSNISVIDEFILQNNNLPSLPGRTFHNLQIVRLMLQNNNLERISNGWLSSSADNLIEIYILEPELRSLPEDSISYLNNLEVLTIKSAMLKRLPKFKSLPKLKYISIESISLLELNPISFKELTSLKSIHIVGSPYLSRLEANLFIDMQNLTVLNITFCSINWIHRHFLFNTPKLEELSLIGNKLIDSGMIGRVVREIPSLRFLRLDFNQIQIIHESDFIDLPNLIEISLANNKIFEIQYRSFHSLPYLAKIYLNHNVLSYIHPNCFFLTSIYDVLEIHLTNNKLSNILEIQQLLDKIPKLTLLDLNYNKIKNIPFESIRGHFLLEKLYLSHNQIEFIERDAFIAMPSLIDLRLKNNSLKNNLLHPIWNLPSLKGLDLSLNYFTRIEPIMMMNLPSLRLIDFSENLLNTIDPASFLECPQLEIINLSYNQLTVLHPATFRHLINLYELNVGYNRLVEFLPGLPRLIENLYLENNQINKLPTYLSPDLDLPLLKVLDLSNNSIDYLDKGTFKSLRQLRKLMLNRNYLYELNGKYFEGLVNIQNLQLIENKISVVHSNSFVDLKNLKFLNLFGNQIRNLSSKAFLFNDKLTSLNLSSNKLEDYFPELFKNLKLEVLSISDNKIQQFPQEITYLRILNLNKNQLNSINSTIISNLFPIIENLQLSKNSINFISKNTFKNLQFLIEIDLSSNNLEEIESYAFNSLLNLKIIKLNQNRLKFLQYSTFFHLPNLHTIYLEDNHLNIIHHLTFNNLPNLLFLNLSLNDLITLKNSGIDNLQSLEILDLSWNKLKVLKDKYIERLKWLIELKISNNFICSIIGNPFGEMLRLKLLALNNNMLTYLDEKVFHSLRNNIEILIIDGNPLNCSCDLLWLKNWINEAQIMGPHCSDGTLVREAPIAYIMCSHSKHNYNYNDIQNNCNENSDNYLTPIPEESGYFYDEFVEYNLNNSIMTYDDNTSLTNPNNQLQSPNSFTFLGMPINSFTFSNFFNNFKANRIKNGRNINENNFETTTDYYVANMGHPIKEPMVINNDIDIIITTTELNEQQMNEETTAITEFQMSSKITEISDIKNNKQDEFRKSTITRVQWPYKEHFYGDFFDLKPLNSYNSNEFNENKNDDEITSSTLKINFSEIHNDHNQWYYLNYNTTSSPFIMTSNSKSYTKFYIIFLLFFYFIILIRKFC